MAMSRCVATRGSTPAFVLAHAWKASTSSWLRVSRKRQCHEIVHTVARVLLVRESDSATARADTSVIDPSVSRERANIEARSWRISGFFPVADDRPCPRVPARVFQGGEWRV